MANIQATGLMLGYLGFFCVSHVQPSASTAGDVPAVGSPHWMETPESINVFQV